MLTVPPSSPSSAGGASAPPPHGTQVSVRSSPMPPAALHGANDGSAFSRPAHSSGMPQQTSESLRMSSNMPPAKSNACAPGPRDEVPQRVVSLPSTVSTQLTEPLHCQPMSVASADIQVSRSRDVREARTPRVVDNMPPQLDLEMELCGELQAAEISACEQHDSCDTRASTLPLVCIVMDLHVKTDSFG